MKGAVKLTFFLFMFFAVISTDAVANDITAEEILKRANVAVNFAGSGQISDTTVTFLNGEGQTVKKRFQTIRFKDEEGLAQRFHVFFDNPSYLTKVAQVVWSDLGKEAKPQNYQPIVDTIHQLAIENPQLVIHKSVGEKKELSDLKLEADNHEIVDSSVHHFLIKGEPKSSEHKDYSYYYMWVLDGSYIPVEIEFYDEKDLLVRLIEVLEIEDIQGLPTITKTLVDDLERGERTVVDFSNVQYEESNPHDVATFDLRLRKRKTDSIANRYLKKLPSYEF